MNETYREVERLEADDLDEGVAGQVDKGQDEEETPERKKAHMHVLFPVLKGVLLAQRPELMLQLIVFTTQPSDRSVFQLCFVGIQEDTIGERENY
jgi:hypothetical protein